MEREQPATDVLLTNVRERLLDRAAMAAAYPNWRDEFAVKHLREAWQCDDAPRRLTVAELMALPDETLRELGFGSWDGALTLVPLWAWPLIADGETLTSISGNVVTKGQDEIDLDVRFGCIAYGFTKPGAVPLEDEASLPSQSEGRDGE